MAVGTVDIEVAALDGIPQGGKAAIDFLIHFAGAAKGDMRMKHLGWLLGATGGFTGAKLLGYGATYGAGAAVVEFQLS